MYFYQVFDVKDGQPTLRKDETKRYPKSVDIEAKVAVEVAEERENIWDNTPETLEIYIGKDGIGFEHVVPDGYSEYTYDPQTTRNYYVGADLDWFIRNALDESQREMLSLNDLIILKFAINNPEFLGERKQK